MYTNVASRPSRGAAARAKLPLYQTIPAARPEELTPANGWPATAATWSRSHGSDVHAVEGSGLTRTNRASPRQVVNLLLAMRQDPVGDDFIQDLALAGHEGTVEDRMHGTAAYGRCRTKTGTITGVSNLSGYCFNRSGRIMAFSILMAGVGNLTLAHLDQDRIAGAIAGY